MWYAEIVTPSFITATVVKFLAVFMGVVLAHKYAQKRQNTSRLRKYLLIEKYRGNNNPHFIKGYKMILEDGIDISPYEYTMLWNDGSFSDRIRELTNIDR